MTDIYCPKCEHEFEGHAWESGKCPNCGNGYIWDELIAEDYSDSWAIVLWESNEYNW